MFAGAAPDATSTVTCSPSALIAAIDAANGQSAPDTLLLATRCAYMRAASNNAWYGSNGLPAITSDIAIVGNGAR